MDDSTPLLEELLAAFFAAPNTLLWCNRNAGDQSSIFSEHVDPWIELYASGSSEVPIVLPCYTDSRLTALYVGAQTSKVGYALMDEVQALLGNAYAEFRPHEAIPENSSGMDAAFVALCPGRAYRIKCGQFADEARLWTIIGEYRAMLEERPIPKGLQVRPFGRIQLDLDEAVQVGDEPKAREFLGELHLTGRLSATNKKFLEIKILAGFGRWSTITDTPILRDVVDGLATPLNVHAAVLKAIYRRYFSSFEAESDVDGALEFYRSNVRSLHAKALETRRGVRSPDAIKLFLIKEAASGDPEESACGHLAVELAEAELQLPFVAALLERIESVVAPRRSIGRAQEAFDGGRYEAAVAILEKLEQSAETLTLLLEAASDDETGELAVRALQVLDSCDAGLLRGLTPRMLSKVKRLRDIAEARQHDPVLHDWGDWCQLAERDLEGLSLEGLAREHLSRGDWSQSGFARATDQVARFADWLVNNSRGELVEALFSEMCAFHCYESYREEFRGVYRSLLEHAVLQGGIGTSRLHNIYELVRCLFTAGVDVHSYVEVVEGLIVLLGVADGIVYLDWRLDVAELLAVYPCLNENVRSKFAAGIAAKLGSYVHRITQSQWAQLELFGVDYGLSDHIKNLRPAGDEVIHVPVGVASQTIAIYSLMEAVAKRAAVVLRGTVDGLRVEVNSDKVATDQLRSLAESVDYFAFAWLTASHAAYDCVKKAIGSDERLLLPQGKGSSSIVRCVLDALGVQ